MYIIFEDTPDIHNNLLPLTYTRPAAMLRTGILTISMRWSLLCKAEVGYNTVEYLRCKYTSDGAANHEDVLHVLSNIEPDERICEAAMNLKPGSRLVDTQGVAIAWRDGEAEFGPSADVVYPGEMTRITYVYDIFMSAASRITRDYYMVTAGRQSQPISPTVTVIGDPSKVFISEGADVEGATLNTKGGPIYIGRDAVVMEGSCLRGPMAVCDHAVVNMGTRIYSGTSIGPWCKVGGELNNVVMQSYSNKAHDGFLGNAVIGEWCNIGAGCVASNLKNDYTPIKLWNYPAHRFVRTDLQFCGVIMGDHTKCGINTMINTATVLGVGVNIHGSGFPRPFVASFSEGSSAGFTDVPMSKFFDIARRMMQRRGIELTENDISIFEAIRETAEAYR